MEYLYILAAILLGGIAGYLIAALALKAKTISRKEMESVNAALNEIKTALTVEQERSRQLNQTLESKNADLRIVSEENATLNATLATYKANLSAVQESLDKANKDILEMKAEVRTKTDEFNEANKRLAGLAADNRALNEKLTTQKEEIEALGKKFNMEFENIAQKILDDKTLKFTKQNKDNLEMILKPLGENIDNFKKKVEEVYDKESKERFSLGKEVEKLVELNKQVSEEANNLTKALKGSSKTQGDWGQMILENILEQSGLVKNREYFVQEFLKDQDGNYLKNQDGRKMQPDIIVAYPDDRKVIIDSKVSLTAYSRYVETDDLDAQKVFLQEHLRSMRKHIDDLSAKNYQDFAPTLDFVMMFVPNEPAYMLAMQTDHDLWRYSFDKRILLMSPTNLIAALKLIVNLWKREYQNQNALAIAERGAALYDKFVGFVDNLTDVGTHIERTQKSYDQALGQLKEGRGNLIGQAEKLRDLGVKAKKSLPGNLVSDALTEGEENGEE